MWSVTVYPLLSFLLIVDVVMMMEVEAREVVTDPFFYKADSPIAFTDSCFFLSLLHLLITLTFRMYIAWRDRTKVVWGGWNEIRRRVKIDSFLHSFFWLLDTILIIVAVLFTWWFNALIMATSLLDHQLTRVHSLPVDTCRPTSGIGGPRRWGSRNPSRCPRGRSLRN